MTSLTSRLRGDLQAGFTVALVTLPQGIAYATLAGVPAAYGLSTAAVAGVVAALVGRSNQIATGPTNTTALLVLLALTPFLGDNGLLRPEALPALATLTLLAGAIRVALALAGGAQLIRFLPESVLVGFTAGAGTLIGGMQLDEALGLPPLRAAGLHSQVGALFETLGEGALPSPPALLLCAATVALIATGRRWWPRFPLPLLAIASAAAGAWALGLDGSSGAPLVSDRAAVPAGWPAVVWPSFDPELVERLFAPASAIALLGTLELTVSARAQGARPDMRREILAQGWANVAGAFAGCFPASASFGRSALLRMFGARTRLAAASSAVIVVPVLLFGSHLVGWVPEASLAGVLLVVAYRMVDRTSVVRLWRASRETRLLLALTWGSTLLLPIEWAILIGSGAGLVIHLANTSAPRLRLLRPERGRLLRVAEGEAPAVVVLEVSGDLHYAAVPPFLRDAERMIPATARFAVLDLSHAHQIRFAALRALEQLSEKLEREETSLRLAGVDDETATLIGRSGSPLRFVRDEPEPGRSVDRCLAEVEEAIQSGSATYTGGGAP